MSGWPHLVAGRGTEKSWSGDRQTDGLMQASDELRCSASGMTIGAFSFSDDGGSERPRRRARQLQRNGRDSGAAGSGRR